MTAEIVIANTSAVVMAADSAVTSSIRQSKKIYNTANKLFTLSKYHPIGVMIYGGGSFMGIPWETIIKMYRKQLGSKEMPSIASYGEDFFKFLENNRELFPDEFLGEYLKNEIYRFFTEIRDIHVQRCKEKLEKDANISHPETVILFKNLLDELKDTIEGIPFTNFFSEDDKKDIKIIIKRVAEEKLIPLFENSNLVNGEESSLIQDIVYQNVIKFIVDNYITGIVFAGFGTEEYFPSVNQFKIYGFVLRKIKRISEIKNISRDSSAQIIPLAQSDMALNFIMGIHPELANWYKRYLAKILIEHNNILISNLKLLLPASQIESIKTALNSNLNDLLNAVNMDTSNEIYERFTKKIMEITQLLPKEELASMAENLVNLTSFRQRITASDETVGGPIDVAVISKGDGFVWTKRKHYFNSELNPHFLSKYFYDNIIISEEVQK